MIETGICQCGCGQKTTIAKSNSSQWGWIKGKPIRFIRGHAQKGERHHSWNGGIRKDKNNHVLMRMPDHPNARKNGYIPLHILIVEKVLGRLLPKDAIVHHIDSNGMNNKNTNFVICENQAYHQILHRRKRAFSFSGHADWRKCKYCKRYDEPRNLCISAHYGVCHKKCRIDFNHKYRMAVSLRDQMNIPGVEAKKEIGMAKGRR